MGAGTPSPLRTREFSPSEGKEKTMKGKLLGIAAGLALMVGLLLVGGTAWAQATKTPIEGKWVFCRTLSPDQQEDRRIWWDEDEVKHVRDQKYMCRHAGDIGGGQLGAREVGLESYDQDSASGLHSGRTYSSFTGEILGEPVTAVGRSVSECTKFEGVWLCSSNDIWHLSDGSLLKFTASWEGGDFGPYVGTLLDPPGRK